MFRYIFNTFVGRRHFWRTASFSEVGELYISRILRIIGVYIASGFASIYLYQLGYSLPTIALLWGLYYLFKIPISYFSAQLVAHIGPKHGILISNFLYIPAMISLGFVQDFGMAAVVAWFVSLALTTTLYQLAYMVDFSKIKSLEHAGKELGFMNIFERLATGVSPIIGGMVALLFGPQTIMFVGAFVFLLSALPLFFTGEQVHTHRRFSLRGFPYKANISGILSRPGMGVDVFSTSVVWSIFIAIVVFPGFGDEIYLTLGSLAVVTIIAAVVASYIFGRLIDRRRGGELMQISAVMNGFVHMMRSFTVTPPIVIAINIANELTTAGVNMPHMRGLFDAADSSGNRVGYMLLSEVASNVGASFAAFVLCVFAMWFGDTQGLMYYFFAAGIATSTVAFGRFRIYKK